MIKNNLKYCPKCKEEKPILDFHKNKSKKDFIADYCKKCTSNYKQKTIWNYIWYNINQRCNNPKNDMYYRYGGRGIKCLITKEELKFLWFRDKAYNMNKPSIDRKDNDEHYELSNCQFIEMSENISKSKSKPILQFTKDGKFIKEWRNISEAEIYYCNSSKGQFGLSTKNKRKTAYGFIWKYKNA